MANAPITQLDFDQIKSNLKEYLKGQERFKDYNFEGSNMAVLLDVLAYNTFQNNFFTNMAVNEMFLDSAQLRGSVVSHAKALNYTPRSRVSASAKVNVTLSVTGVGGILPTFVVIPAKTKFNARCGNKTFSFFTDNAYTITPVNNTYTYYGAMIYEGAYVQEIFNVSGTSDKFVLSNTNVDTSSIRVYLRDSVDDQTETEFVQRTNVFGASSADNVFYVQAYDEEKYQLIFGLDNFGVQPKSGNIIRVEYRVTNGEEANGITSFIPATSIAGYPATSTLVSAAEGGAEKESIDSIRYFAPKSLQVQDRAITESDYEILLKAKFPEIQAISVYGGEELNPPRYGRVVVAVDVAGADGVSENNKTKYSAYLHQRSPIGIEPIITSPQFMFATVSTRVYYDTRKTAASSGDISKIVAEAISNFNTENLNDFRATLRVSRLQAAIDDADAHILSNDLEVNPFIPLNPVLNQKNVYDVSFANALVLDQHIEVGESITNHRPAIKSSSFTYNGSSAFIMDNGSGQLDIVKLNTISGVSSYRFLVRNIGTVNYETGRVVIRNLNVSAFAGSEIKLIGRTRIPTITSPKSRILTIRDSDVKIDVVGVN